MFVFFDRIKLKKRLIIANIKGSFIARKNIFVAIFERKLETSPIMHILSIKNRDLLWWTLAECVIKKI